MHINRLAVYMFLIVILGCGGGGAAAPTGPAEPVGTIFVDSVNGNDLSGDSTILPFRTVSYAIDNIGGATQIKLAPGTYDSGSGEVFPILVPAGVTISSYPIDLANNQYALVRGTGSYTSQTLSITKQATFVLSDNSTVRSIVIEGPSGVGVWNEAGSAVVENCVIRNSDTGVLSGGSSALLIERSTIQNNVSIGLDTLNNASPVLTQTKIMGNGIGILVSGSAMPSFNEQSNELSANTFCDLRHLGSAAIAAQDVLWDNDPFSFAVVSICSGGANIANEGTGSVSFQYIPPAGEPVFIGTRRLLLLNSPSRGAVISTNQPDFSWIPGGAAITIMAVWDHRPAFTNGELGDKSSIQWLWHAGIGTGVPGSVTFNDGRIIPSGDLNNLAAPQPLQRGKSYYWAVWEWDDEALTIRASSELGYFTVLN